MKQHADAHQRDVNYEVGQWVYVKVCPFHQRSVTCSVHPKLSKRFFGPFQITEKIGPVAYHLQLPDNAKLHLVFHCSLLRPHHGPTPTVTTDQIPLTVIDNHPMLTLLSILSSKLDESTQPPTRLVLVQWVGQAPEDSTWETWADMKDKYHLEDKVDLEEGGIDSNTHTTRGTTSNTHAHTSKPNRNTQPPHYLKDYIT